MHHPIASKLPLPALPLVSSSAARNVELKKSRNCTREPPNLTNEAMVVQNPGEPFAENLLRWTDGVSVVTTVQRSAGVGPCPPRGRRRPVPQMARIRCRRHTTDWNRGHVGGYSGFHDVQASRA